MFDFIKRWIWGELPKDKVRSWAIKKITQEEEEEIFKKKCLETPSFSKCVIPNAPIPSKSVSPATDMGVKTRSQKQKHQLKSYKDAVENSVDI
tara:strand:+ start:1507 stop:1785 length:279 start_codon:yes stop_codon:yes gene_type:complete